MCQVSCLSRNLGRQEEFLGKLGGGGTTGGSDVLSDGGCGGIVGAYAGVAAVMGLAKIHGLIIDKQQAEVLVARRPTLDPNAPGEMAEADWLASIRNLSKAPLIDLMPESQASGPKNGRTN